MTTEMRKYEMILMLARRYGYSSYLEICTPTTGHTFSFIDPNQFPFRQRIMYRCPPEFSDGLQLDHRTEVESSEPLISQLVKAGRRFDVVFVDPFHTHLCSMRDIVYGLHLMKDTGVMVIHDCNPPCAEWATPEFIVGNWCGATYAAFLDIVLSNPELSYITVDSDYGCGIIVKSGRPTSFSNRHPDAGLTRQWRALDITQKYPFFDQHRAELLRLTSPEEFRRLIAHQDPVPRAA